MRASRQYEPPLPPDGAANVEVVVEGAVVVGGAVVVLPEADVPEADVPEADVPEADVPEAEADVPEADAELPPATVVAEDAEMGDDEPQPARARTSTMALTARALRPAVVTPTRKEDVTSASVSWPNVMSVAAFVVGSHPTTHSVVDASVCFFIRPAPDGGVRQ